MDIQTSKAKATPEVVPASGNGHRLVSKPIFTSVKEAARLLNLSPWSVYKLCDSGVLASGKEGRRRQVSMASVREYADQVLEGGSTTDRDKGKRPFGFAIEIAHDRALFVDWRGDSVLALKVGHGWFVSTNHFTINSIAEETRLEEMWTNTGMEVGRRQAEKAAAELEQA